MKQRDADLSVVDQIVRVLLPHAKSKFAGAERQMSAKLELRVALGLEIERRLRRLQRQVEQVRGARVDVFERERLEETPHVCVERGTRPEKADDFQARTEGTEAPREIRRTDREKIVAQAVVDFVAIG